MDTSQSITINKAYKFRLYPTCAQAEDFVFHFGAVRYVYNRYRAAREGFYQDCGEGLTYNDCCLDLTDHKKEMNKEWLQSAYNQSMQQSLRDLDKAYRNFFEGRAAYPRFKSKHDKQSIRYLFTGGGKLRIQDGRIRIPKVGMVKVIQHRELEGKPKNMTVSKTKSGKFFVSIQCEVRIPMPQKEGGSVGLDWGLKAFLTTSSGDTVSPPQYFRKAEHRLQRLQRSLSRKGKGSNNRRKARLLVARQHEKVANQRIDFLHKLSRSLIDTHSHIGIEDLNIKGMLQNHSLAKSISDSGWHEFVRQMKYKGEWYGCDVVKVDRWFVSSKTCNACGEKNRLLELSDRRWLCESCGVLHDRDRNAAINILKESTARTVGINAHGDMSSGRERTQPGNPTAYEEVVSVHPV